MIQEDNFFYGKVPLPGQTAAPGDTLYRPPEGRQRLPQQPPQRAPQTADELEADRLANIRKQQEIDEAARKAAQEAATGPELKIDQAKAAGFMGRMINAESLYGLGILPRSAEFQTMREFTPQNLSTAYQYSPQERAAKSYIDDWIRANLRLQSGAVIGDEEMDREYKLYFPVPGDGPEDLLRKKGLRKQAIVSMKTQSGPAISEVPTVGGKSLSGEEILPATPGSYTEKTFPSVEGTPLNLEGLGEEGGLPKMEVDLDMRRPPSDPPLTATATFDPNDPRRPAPLTKDMTEGEGFAVPDWLKDLGTGAAKTAGTAVEAGLAIPGLVANPITAGVNWATGSNINPDLGENARLALGLPKYEGVLGNVAEAAMGALGGAGLFGQAAKVVTNPNALAAFTTLAKEPIRQTIAGVTGTLSGEGARAAGAGPVGQTIATIAGGGLGYGGTKVVKPSRITDPELAARSIKADVDVNQAMIEGNRPAINRAAARESNPATREIMQEGWERSNASIERSLKRDVRPTTTVPDEVEVGRSVRQMAKDIIGPDGLDKKAANKLYKKAEAVDGDPIIDQVEMRGKIDAKITELMKNPKTNAAEIKALKDYRSDVAGPKPLSNLRQLRTTINDNISGTDLTRSAAQRRADAHMVEILKGTNKDIENGLSPEALKAWKKADAVFSKQMDYKDVLQKFIGKNVDDLTDEEIFGNVKRAVEKDHAALSELYRRLPPGKRDEVASFFADMLGKRGPNEPFTAAKLISQALKIGDRQRVTLFGQKGADAIDNLLWLSRRLERSKSSVNTSRTTPNMLANVLPYLKGLLGTVVTAGGAAGGGMAGGGGGAAAGAIAGAALTGAAAAGKATHATLTAKNLMDTRVTRILADAASARDPASASDIAIRLGTLIARDPSLAEALGPLQQELEKAGGKKRDINALQAEDTR